MITPASLARHWLPNPAIISQITRQGFPAIIDLGSISVGFFIITYFVSRFGQEAVAAFGAAARIEQVAMLPLIGLDVATLSLIAQNNGAGLAARVHQVLATTARYGLLIMLIGAVLIFVFAGQLMSIFSSDAEVVRIGAPYIQIKAFVLLPTALSFVGLAAMRGLKKPFHALALSMTRMVILPTIIIYILVVLLGFGLSTIWWVTFSVTTIAGIVAFLHARSLLPEQSIHQMQAATTG